MKKLLARLAEIENAVRSVRDELIARDESTTVKGLSAVDVSNLERLTPVSWLDAFAGYRRPEPRQLTPYESLAPDLLVGFSGHDVGAVMAEQQPFISSASKKVQYSFNVWTVRPVQWLTLEFRIPEAICERYSEVFFMFAASVRQSHVVRLVLYRRGRDGSEKRSLVSEIYIPADSFSEIASIKIPSLNDVEETKLYLEFDMSVFHGVTIDDAQLFAPLVE